MAKVDGLYQIMAGSVIASDLANSGVTSGTYGSTTQIPVIVVNAQGQITGVTLATVTGGGSFTPGAVQAPSSVIFDHADYLSTTELITWRAKNTTAYNAGAIAFYGWQTSLDNTTWTTEVFAGDTYQGVSLTSGNQYARSRAYSLITNGGTAVPSAWVTSSVQAYSAPTSSSSTFVAPVSGYQALLSVAPGYQLAPGSASFVAAPLLTDRTSGDSTSGYAGATVAAGKPSTIAFQSGNSIASGIIAAWPFSEGTGTTVADISGHSGLGLSFVGTGNTWTTGPNGTVLTTNGSGSLAGVDNALFKPTAGFTISAYINAASVQPSSNSRWYRKYGSAGVYVNIGNSLTSAFSTSATVYSPSTNVASYEGSYHLYTVVEDPTSGNITYYVDGTAISTTPFTGTPTWDTAVPYFMGSTTGDSCTGSIDVAYEWGRALSAAEVASLASNPYQLIGTNPSTTNITALLDTGTLGSLPISTIKITRTWSQQLAEVLEYSANGTSWTAIPTGYTPVSNAGTATSLQTTVSLGTSINSRYLRYSGKDTGTNAAILLTDLNLSSVVTFTPTQVAGLTVWLNAGAITGSTNNTALPSWADTSGGSHNATQATGTLQPLYIASGLNGKPVVRFNGTSQFMSLGNLSSFFPSAASMFAVVTYNGSQHQCVYSTTPYNSTTNAGDDFWYYTGNSGAYLSVFGSTRSGSYAAGTMTTTGSNLYSLVATPTTSELWLNQTDKTSFSQTFTGGTSHLLGHSNNSANNVYLNGDVSELLIYSSALSTSDRLSIESYLKTKYGI